MSLNTAAIPISLALSFLRNLADSLVILLIVSHSTFFQPGVTIPSVLMHLFLGLALSGLTVSSNPKKHDILLAPMGNFLLAGLLLLSGATRFFVDPIFLGFAIGIGRNAFVPTLPFAGNLGFRGRYLLVAAGNVELAIGFAIAWLLTPTTADFSQQTFLYPIAFQAMAFFATLFCYWVKVESLVPQSPPLRPQEKESLEDDIIPRCLNALFQGLVLGIATATTVSATAFQIHLPESSLLAIAGSLAVGFFLGLVTKHPSRCIGLVPISCFITGCALLASQYYTSPLLSYTLLVATTHLLMVCQRACRPEHPAAGKASILISALGPWLVGIGTLTLIFQRMATPKTIGMVLLLSSPVLTWILLRPFMEEWASLFSMVISKTTVFGPGPDQIPARGPVILISNHCSYLDPFWIGKVIPRRFTPMMTSVFYDLPVVRWLMANVIKAIRVEASAFRREAPELDQAAKVLTHGGCLLIFPEGKLRRRAEQLLLPFGQGAWLLIKRFPDVPVHPIWIEGSWGSMMSYFNGPPLTNKRIDIRRPIRLGIGPAIKIPQEILDNQRACRAFLQKAVLSSRQILGLDAPAQEEASTAEGDPEDSKDQTQPTP